MITSLIAAAAALLALPRPSPARVRLPAVMSARGAGPLAALTSAAAPRRGPFGPFESSVSESSVSGSSVSGSSVSGASMLTASALTASRRPYLAAGGAGGAAVVVLLLVGLRLAVAMAGGLVVTVLTQAGIGAGAARRALIDDAALARGLGVLEAELVAGAREDAALTAAADAAGRHGGLLRQAAASTGYGEETADVLARSSSLRPLSAAWRVRHACGAPLAEVVAQVARDVDLRRKRQRAVDSALAGPRSSSALLAALPLVGMGLGTVMGARPVHFLFASNAGAGVLLIGVGLDVTGWLWTAAMVRRAGR